MIYVGSARIGENGKATGGKVGDQKQTTNNDLKGEVSQQTFYNHSKGWYILRAELKEVRKALAEAMITACNNPNIGYNQEERNGIVKYGVATKVKTNSDCSSLVRACIKKATNTDVGNFTTLNEKDVLVKSGLFKCMGKYVNSDDTPLYNGDILVTCTKGHTVIVTSGGLVECVATYYPQYNGTSSKIDEVFRAIGVENIYIGNVMKRKPIAIANGFKNYTGKADENLGLIKYAKVGVLKRVGD